MRQRLILMVVAALMLPGCSGMSMGAGGVRGTYAEDEPRTAAERAEDARITAAVKMRFIGDKYVNASDINVDTFKGVVILRGDVRTHIARSQAEKLASEVKGVERVSNNIRLVE